MRDQYYPSQALALFRNITTLSVLLALLLAAMPVATVHADGPTPIEDQSYTAPGIAAVAFSGCCQFVAQTFAAGYTGALTGVSIDVASGGDVGELRVTVVGVTDGVPNGHVLGERYLWTPKNEPMSSAPLSYVIELGPIYVTEGTQYAIVVNYTGTNADGSPHGTWSGGQGDPYPRGKVFLGDDYSLTNWTAAAADLDLHFRTFVIPNVPVSDLSVERISGAKKAKACDIFQETYRVTNLGPDPATKVTVTIGGMDQFDFVSVDRVSGRYSDPFDLAPGASRLIVAYYQVTGYVPGESRIGWISADVNSEVWPDIAFDLNRENNTAGMQIRLVSRPVETCWP